VVTAVSGRSGSRGWMHANRMPEDEIDRRREADRCACNVRGSCHSTRLARSHFLPVAN
jgi:hypothetical protein